MLYSFACRKSWWPEWAQSFDHLLLDSGAYSELNPKNPRVDLGEYVEWVQQWPWADAWAGLDDIRGDWRRSLDNYKRGGFPTFHPGSDPDDLLPELVAMARERGGWIGVGLEPPRTGKERLVRNTLDRIPDELHVHGWALGMYAHLALDSTDSTTPLRGAMALRKRCGLDFLTFGEALEIEMKRLLRRKRKPQAQSDQLELA